MDDRDRFAVWVSDAVLRAGEDEFTAEALAALARKAEGDATSLDAELAKQTKQEPRAGDIGLEMIGPVLIPILIEFGRALWDAYSKRLAEQGGEALADATLAKVKEFARGTWSGRDSPVPLDEVERQLRQAALRAKLDEEETERLVAGLRAANSELRNPAPGA